MPDTLLFLPPRRPPELPVLDPEPDLGRLPAPLEAAPSCTGWRRARESSGDRGAGPPRGGLRLIDARPPSAPSSATSKESSPGSISREYSREDSRDPLLRSLSFVSDFKLAPAYATDRDFRPSALGTTRRGLVRRLVRDSALDAVCVRGDAISTPAAAVFPAAPLRYCRADAALFAWLSPYDVALAAIKRSFYMKHIDTKYFGFPEGPNAARY